ncbi:transposase [Sulfitobacter sp. TSTF-M16]|uniref:Transposase n=1 Tax=Sulfitobacter aestuariivivens TaxID=2766981 RepID=A0A927HD22_9RHOB|nr:transposase [Sulfitobacter aestuariivivens]
MSNEGFLVHRSQYGAKARKKPGTSKDAADKLVRGIKRKTRNHYSPEKKIKIVLAWSESGRIYGYRKLTNDLRDQGECVSKNRVARRPSLVGIAADGLQAPS